MSFNPLFCGSAVESPVERHVWETATSVPHSVVLFGLSINRGPIVSWRCHAGWLWTHNVKLPLIYGLTQIHLLQPTVSVPGQNPLQEQLKAYIKCHGDLERRLKTLCAHSLTCVPDFRVCVCVGRVVRPPPGHLWSLRFVDILSFTDTSWWIFINIIIIS